MPWQPKKPDLKNNPIYLEGKINNTIAQLAETEAEVRRKKEPEDLSDRTLALVTGKGTVNVLSIPQDRSVSARKTTFLKPVKNLFDIKAVKNDFGLNSSGNEVANAYNCISDYIEGGTGDVIYISYGDGNSFAPVTSIRAVFYDAGFNILETFSAFSSGTTITNVNARYFRLNLAKTTANSYFQVEKNALTRWQPYVITLTPDIQINAASDELNNNTITLVRGVSERIERIEENAADGTLVGTTVLSRNQNNEVTSTTKTLSGKTIKSTFNKVDGKLVSITKEVL